METHEPTKVTNENSEKMVIDDENDNGKTSTTPRDSTSLLVGEADVHETENKISEEAQIEHGKIYTSL